MAYYRCGPTAIGSRASWSVTSPVDPKPFERPLSGTYDRIFNAFERTNAFEYVKSTFEGKEERHRGSADVIVNRKMSSSFERADCALAALTPCSDDEDFRERALYSQARQLFPLQEDLADWINKTIGITYLTGENFLDVLDNGAELCQLAAVIHDRAREALDQGLIVGPVPAIRGRCWQRAARRSFFSRDNAENFITFCRELGVHENLLFESDDLVLHNQPRQVVLCLLEVARLATRFRVEPPGLVALETEIAMEERDSGLGSTSPWQFRDASPPPLDRMHTSTDESKTSLNDISKGAECGVSAEDAVGAGGAAEADARSDSDSDTDVPLKPTNELDKRVQSITRLLERGCRCGEGKCSRMLKVKKVGEGRYNIAGRNVFIRLLKGRHMMVRVGGGWDTLEHFLSRHEPCQVRLVTPGRRDLLPLAPAAPASHAAPAAPTPSAAPAPAPAPAPHSNRTTPSPTNLKEKSISPASSRASLSKESSIAGLSPAHSKTSISGKSSPVDAKANGRVKLVNGKISPPSRTSTPVKPAVARNRSALTLPLNEQKPGTPRSRKQSAPASYSTPNTPVNRATERRKSFNAPKKSRSMSLAIQKEEKKAETPEKTLTKGRSASITGMAEPSPRKTRSQSLASTPLGEARRVGGAALAGRSVSLATGAAPLTQAAIEDSIRRSLEATIADHASPKKPFLHIKAKYRSPPPREVPPR